MGDTALIMAAWSGHTDVVERLLAVRGIDVNAKGSKFDAGFTALTWAATNGHADVVELLLAAPGIDVNAKTDAGNTALMKAASHGDTDIVRRLLAAPGIDVKAKGRWGGNTALMLAAENGHTDVVNLIRGLIARRRFRGIVRMRPGLRDAKVRAAERVYAPGGPGYNEIFARQKLNFKEGLDEI